MKNFLIGAVALALFGMMACQPTATTSSTDEKEEMKEPDFKISLAQWSLHKAFFDSSLSADDFPSIAAGYGINSIELVNQFYKDKAEDMEYWKTFKQACDDAKVSVGLIMCDGLGHLGDADEAKRNEAVANHHNWVDIAKLLGAHSIRVNAAGEGTAEEVAANAAMGLKKLGEYGATQGINVIVENHGGYSSDGSWLAGVISTANMENVGTLPDFGNFCIERSADGCANEYDRYKGTKEIMPFAKGVSAKSNVFDEEGNEANMDYMKLMKIVKEAGYKGYVGIEYEGKELSEDEGIKATKALLEKVFAAI
ncbi:MAG: sugar phosphate isomerase/epimerase family protein [Bacteroidota bacterium]